MASEQSVSKKWAGVVEFYREISSKHRQEPMTALVLAVAESGVKNNIWPSTSHFVLWTMPYDAEAARQYPFTKMCPQVVVEHWEIVDKFKLLCLNVQGVPCDIKWCELAEAEATLRYLFRIIGQAD